MQRCPHCQAELKTPLVCLACGRLLEPPEDSSPFALTGRAPQFALDAAALDKDLRTTMRYVHPDNFATAPEAERARAERASALLNGAYGVLADPVERADWLVRAQGGPSENEQRAMPQAFLHEVLEWNEQLEEARAGSAPAGLDELQARLREKRDQALANVERLLSPLPERGAPHLSQARSELNAIRYLERTLSEIEELHLRRPARHP